MATERDVTTNSPDGGYNGQIRILAGKIQLVGGGAAEPLPASVNAGHANANYTNAGFVGANAGHIQVSVDIPGHRIVFISSNAADANELTWIFVGTTGPGPA